LGEKHDQDEPTSRHVWRCAAGRLFFSTSSYKEPTTGQRARVRFALDQSVPRFHLVIVCNYEDQECTGENEWMRLANGSIIHGSPKRVDMPFWEFHRNGAK